MATEVEFLEFIVQGSAILGEALARHRIQMALNESRQALSYQSCHDQITGLPNRKMFIEQLEEAIIHARRYQTGLALLYLDLDRFKSVNETLGHRCGDLILQEAARRLVHGLRASDAAARIGDDEFTVLLPGADETSVMRVVNKIRKKLQEKYRIGSKEITLGVSVGIALYPKDGQGYEALLKHADAAMYHAKENHINVHYYSSDLEEYAKRRLWLEQGLAKAIEEDQLRLYYQSQHLLDPEQIIGVEALIRWQHPNLGMISPMEFIPVAEETGQIQAMTHWVVAEAGRQAVLWESAGMRPDRIGINLSAVQLGQSGLVAGVVDCIKKAGARPEWFEVEITETAAMQDPEMAIKIMQELVDAGMCIAVDDFGTGYSSLAYLKRLPAAWLKIDMEFIRNLPENEEDKVIVRSTIALAHALGMKVIAEGVETKDQLDFLQGEGCDAVQGYWFSKPLPSDEILSYLQQWH